MAEPVFHQGRCEALEWAAITRPYPGQHRSGDGFLVEATEAGTFVAMVDALGHGEEAADVADRALACLQGSADRSLSTCLTTCHTALRGSRGAAITLMVIDLARRQLAWAGVGNVEAAMLRRQPFGGSPLRRSVTLRGGVVGDRLPPLRPSTEAIDTGDWLIAATDGLQASFLDDVDLSLPPAGLAQHLHRAHAKATDDALVLVARCNGRRAEVRSEVAPYV